MIKLHICYKYGGCLGLAPPCSFVGCSRSGHFLFHWRAEGEGFRYICLETILGEEVLLNQPRERMIC